MAILNIGRDPDGGSIWVDPTAVRLIHEMKVSDESGDDSLCRILVELSTGLMDEQIVCGTADAVATRLAT